MTNNPPQFNPKDILNLYLNQEYDQLSQQFIKILEYFEINSYLSVSIQAQYFIDVFCKNFLYFLTQPDYYLEDQYIIRFIQFNPLIANLVALTSLKTTDYYLDILRNQPQNFAKILIIYSARNNSKFDYDIFFNAHPQFACLWYSSILHNYHSLLVNEQGLQNLKAHLSYEHPQLTEFYHPSEIYFASTFIDQQLTRKIKQQINYYIQNSLAQNQVNIINYPQEKNIAIITYFWDTDHPVCRTLSNYIIALVPDYDVTLVYLGEQQEDFDISMFKEVIYLEEIEESERTIKLDKLNHNQFLVAYFPEVGIGLESTFLANLRIAPIQICGLGNPVSTFGSQIDYYISGLAVESNLNPEKNYSEKLVLIPGYGIINQPINYQKQNIIDQQKQENLIINCPWAYPKINYYNLKLLSQIIVQSKTPILIRFFIGKLENLLNQNSYLVFVKEMEKILGKEHFQIIPFQSYQEYMKILEEGSLSLDAFPISSYNAMIDSLYLAKPIITLEGENWYNRIVAQFLKDIGLTELIVDNEEAYLNLTLKLIEDQSYREQITEYLQEQDLNKTIFHQSSAKEFKKALDYLIKNHEELKKETFKQTIKLEEYSWFEIK